MTQPRTGLRPPHVLPVGGFSSQLKNDGVFWQVQRPRKWSCSLKAKIEWGEYALSVYCDLYFFLKLGREVQRIEGGYESRRDNGRERSSCNQSVDW